MPTTIQIDEGVHGKLKTLKEKLRASSYNEVIERLLEGFPRAKRSMFGAHPEMLPFEKTDEAEFHEP